MDPIRPVGAPVSAPPAPPPPSGGLSTADHEAFWRAQRGKVSPLPPPPVVTPLDAGVTVRVWHADNQRSVEIRWSCGAPLPTVEQIVSVLAEIGKHDCHCFMAHKPPHDAG